MNLKGVGLGSAVGKCVSVLYDEGGTELVGYRGVVVYAERTRHAHAAPAPSNAPPSPCTAAATVLARYATGVHQHSQLQLPPPRSIGRVFVVFDDLDEADGAWCDDSDEWQWVPTPRTGLRPPVPVAGAWRPGLVAGGIEKIYLSRPTEQGPLLLVKWKGLVRARAYATSCDTPTPPPSPTTAPRQPTPTPRLTRHPFRRVSSRGRVLSAVAGALALSVGAADGARRRHKQQADGPALSQDRGRRRGRHGPCGVDVGARGRGRRGRGARRAHRGGAVQSGL